MVGSCALEIMGRLFDVHDDAPRPYHPSSCAEMMALRECLSVVGKEFPMIAVIFEVWPADGRKQAYLDIAASLKPELERIDGFISIERFQSLTDETKLL